VPELLFFKGVEPNVRRREKHLRSHPAIDVKLLIWLAVGRLNRRPDRWEYCRN
jgi:hypothetical protein